MIWGIVGGLFVGALFVGAMAVSAVWLERYIVFSVVLAAVVIGIGIFKFGRRLDGMVIYPESDLDREIEDVKRAQRR